MQSCVSLFQASECESTIADLRLRLRSAHTEVAAVKLAYLRSENADNLVEIRELLNLDPSSK